MKWWVPFILLGGGIVWIGSMQSRGQIEPGAVKLAEGTKAERTVTAMGKGTIRVSPDAARIEFGIRTIGSTTKDTVAQSVKDLKRLKEAMDALKIAGLRIGVTGGSPRHIENLEDMPEAFEDVKPKGRPAKGVPKAKDIPKYEVIIQYAILVTNSDPVELREIVNRVTDAALSNGANTSSAGNADDPFGSNPIPNVLLARQDQTAIRRQALAKAVEDAMENAKAMAAGMKVRVTGPVSVIDEAAVEVTSPKHQGTTVVTDAHGPPPPRGFTVPAAGQNPGVGVVWDEIEVSVRVALTCAY